jgi:hypothetical protein
LADLEEKVRSSEEETISAEDREPGGKDSGASREDREGEAKR